jgi:hypothetical protein
MDMNDRADCQSKTKLAELKRHSDSWEIFAVPFRSPETKTKAPIRRQSAPDVSFVQSYTDKKNAMSSFERCGLTSTRSVAGKLCNEEGIPENSIFMDFMNTTNHS